MREGRDRVMTDRIATSPLDLMAVIERSAIVIREPMDPVAFILEDEEDLEILLWLAGQARATRRLVSKLH